MTERKRRFSERIGEGVRPLQVRTMDERLKNSLWNLIRNFIPSEDGTRRYERPPSYAPVLAIAVRVLALPAERVDTTVPRRWLYGLTMDHLPWYTIYDVLEFIAGNAGTLFGSPHLTPDSVHKMANEILEAENAGYRFVGGLLTEITSPTEAEAVEATFHHAEAHGLTPVSEHLRQSLALLGKRPEPDYRNAIKEAISAVESAAKLIAKEKKGTLDDALDLLDQRVSLHGALKGGLTKLYGFTSDSGGIRHALLDAPTVDASDARFFVVACAAFVSWLITKADAAGLLQTSR